MAALRRWVARAIDQLQGRPPQVRRPQRIFFIHIAKTAGTSMRRILEREFGAQLVYPGSPHLRRLPDGCYPHGSAMLRDFARLPPHNVPTGHVTAAMAEMLPRPCRTATILREPVQRSLSMLGQSDGAMLTRAIRRLETLDFVGLTERFEESCAVFDARFGTAVSRSVRRDLVRRPEGSELAEFIPRIEPLLEHDRALYERAQAAFVPAG